MASPPVSEASEIRRRGRQRLIGAIALVAILVVFVPMVLDSEPRPQRSEKSLAIPPKADAPALPAPPPALPAKSDAPKADAPKAEAPNSASDASAKVAVVETRPAAPATAPQPAAAAAKLDGFAVQVGAFRDEAKLAQARQKLVAAGVVHYTERLESPSGPLTRLRAGPFPSRGAAEAALATLKRAALDGKVVPLP